MDQFTAGVVSGAAGQLLANGVATLGRWASADVPLDTGSNIGFVAEAQDADNPTILDLGGAIELEKFLRSPSVKLLSDAMALSRFIFGAESQNYREVAVACARDFEDLGLSASISSLDSRALAAVWTEYMADLDSAFLPSGLIASLDISERDSLAQAVSSVGGRKKPKTELPRYVRRIVELARDRERLDELSAVGTDIRRAVGVEFSQLKLNHAFETDPRQIADLYIHRSLMNDLGVSRAAESLLDSRRRIRAVVTGAPGAGKSTLTQHIVHSASQLEFGRVPLFMKALEFGDDQPQLVEAVAQSSATLLQMPEVNANVVHDLLCMGTAFVVFDGLDEILSPAQRQKFARRVDAFAFRYPLASVVVTSREVGYERAPLNGDLFTRYRLQPFSEAQVVEYVERWFAKSPDGDDRARAFLREISSVPDLPQNPLMLSLLCTLYKARGHIPRNRRQVYSQCADLLFNRWDSMRLIDQPVDHVQHGQDLMEDLALWFFKSRSAQRGVGEGQLRKVLSNFFESTAGALKADAKHRASGFLDFCSDRAWLLGRSGTNEYGERVFVFTHQTFMEFFASEGMARSAKSSEELADTIIRQYEVNASSVVPELVLQAAGATNRTAPIEILRHIKSKERLFSKDRGEGRFVVLRLRLLVVSTANQVITDEILFDALAGLRRADCKSLEYMEALLELPRDPRSRLLGYLLDSPELSKSMPADIVECRRAFLEHWCSMVIGGGAGIYSKEWEEVASALWVSIEDPIGADMQAARLYARHRLGRSMEVEEWELSPSLRSDSSMLDSSLGLAIDKALRGEPMFAGELEVFDRALARILKVKWTDADVLYLREVLQRALPDRRVGAVPLEGESLRAVIACIGMACWEYMEGDSFAVMEQLSEASGVPLVDLANMREGAATNGKKVPGATLAELSRELGVPFARWSNGSKDFVSAPDE